MSAGIKNTRGPVRHADGALRRRSFDGVNYLVGIAGAYNAMGLIGSECNGIFVLDETNKNVLTDQNNLDPSGGYNGPSKAQWAAFEWVMKMPEADFIQWIKDSPRYRGTGAWEQ